MFNLYSYKQFCLHLIDNFSISLIPSNFTQHSINDRYKLSNFHMIIHMTLLRIYPHDYPSESYPQDFLPHDYPHYNFAINMIKVENITNK